MFPNMEILNFRNSIFTFISNDIYLKPCNISSYKHLSRATKERSKESDQ